MEGQAHSSL